MSKEQYSELLKLLALAKHETIKMMIDSNNSGIEDGELIRAIDRVLHYFPSINKSK